MFTRVLLLVSAAACLVAPPRVSAQTGSAAAATPPNSADAARVKRVPISKSVFGDAGIIVNARDDGFVEVAAAVTQKTVLIQLRTMAARAWVDSTARMLRARPRRSNTPRTYRADVVEHGSSTTMAMNRKVTAGESEYSLFFADKPETGFTIPIEKSEADVFVAVVRKAVVASAKMLDKVDTTAAAKDSAPKAAPAKKPAAKKPASPPAQGQPKSTPPATAQPKQPTPAQAKPQAATPAAQKP